MNDFSAALGTNDESNKTVYEIKRKEVCFEDQTCNLILVRDINEISEIEYAK